MNAGYEWRERLPAGVGGALLDHLVQRWRHGDATTWSARLARGELALDGVVASVATTAVAGAELVWRRPPWEEPVVPLGFVVLHRDPELLAVGKPAGLPTMPSGGRFLEHTLLHQVRRRFPEAAPLHRLDRGTSGLVLFARTAAASRALNAAWQRGAVQRLYRARVHGRIAAAELHLATPIGEAPHPAIGRVFVAAADGRPALTVARVVERAAATTLLEIELGSGRPHQIRIHLAAAGHPLLGEPFYAAGGGLVADPAARPGDSGYRLHAWRLRFAHPADGRAMDLECPVPSDLRPA